MATSTSRARITRLLLCMLLFAGGWVDSQAQPRVVAYLASWSGTQVTRPEKLTHLNVAFAHIDATNRVRLDSPAMGQMLLNLQKLKKQNPRLKILVSVGGWQADGFSDAALSEISRRTFAASVTKLLRDFSSDGVDVDW